MTLWYLNNSDEPESYEGDAFESLVDHTRWSSVSAMLASIAKEGVTIEGKFWIPPHRILRVDL
jgi:hypothetical protein